MPYQEIIVGVGLAVATGGIGWVGTKLKRHWHLPDKVDQLAEDVKYVRTNFDTFLISAASRRE